MFVDFIIIFDLENIYDKIKIFLDVIEEEEY